jgi:hypothetical protein
MTERSNKRGTKRKPARRPQSSRAHGAARAAAASRERADMVEVRRSSVHGRGVFALRRIRKGTRVIEYLGDRVSHREADRRYDHKKVDDNHTFLFIVDRGVVIDAGNNGNEARYINHSCNPNCESVIEDRRVFIEAVCTIQPGEELNYDYQIGRDKDDPPNVDEIFACRCGADHCRGTMLWPPKRKPRAKTK